jgi:hypothetical protein
VATGLKYGLWTGCAPAFFVARAMHIAARLGVWFVAGTGLVIGMGLTAMALNVFRPSQQPAWWLGGLSFIGIELVAHLVMQLRGRPSFYNGRGWCDVWRQCHAACIGTQTETTIRDCRDRIVTEQFPFVLGFCAFQPPPQPGLPATDSGEEKFNSRLVVRFFWQTKIEQRKSWAGERRNEDVEKTVLSLPIAPSFPGKPASST